jgi:hypothetical protein
MVVSEKIIKNNPTKNVISFNLKYFEFSFDSKVKKRDVKDNTKI